MRMLHAACIATLTIIVAASLRSEMICYEGFGYAPTNSINTLAGSGDFGFLTAWSFSTGNRRASIAAPGLIYANPPLPSSTLLTNANLMRRTNFNFGVPERTIDVSPFPQLVDANGNEASWAAMMTDYFSNFFEPFADMVQQAVTDRVVHVLPVAAGGCRQRLVRLHW